MLSIVEYINHICSSHSKIRKGGSDEKNIVN